MKENGSFMLMIIINFLLACRDKVESRWTGEGTRFLFRKAARY